VSAGMSMALKRPPLNQGMSWSPYSPPGRLHRREQRGDAAGGLAGVATGVREEVGEDAGRKHRLVLGEHAEQALDEEMGDALTILASAAHGGGEVGEVAGGLGGDRRGRLLGTQAFPGW
jgi:hypothetical protein